MKSAALTASSAAMMSAGGLGWTMANSALGAEGPSIVDHFVPAEKNLDPAWVSSLFEKGTRRVFRGDALNTIGMPCGGICAGQLYVRGDGTLASWLIANNTYNTGYGRRPMTATPMGSYPQNYHTYEPYSPVSQGFALSVAGVNGDFDVRRLDRTGYDDIRFLGEYPVATIDYQRKDVDDFPVDVEAEVFSPFIPLNTKDSALPVTVLRYKLTNRTNKSVEASLTGWLENPVFMDHRRIMNALARNRTQETEAGPSVLMDAVATADRVIPLKRETVFENFEGGSFDNWKVEGTAFGSKPATGELPNQNPESDFLFEGVDFDFSLSDWEGEYLANSHHGGAGATGRLISRSFTVSERFITMRVSGGMDARHLGIRLVVDGKVVRREAGVSFGLGMLTRYWHVEEYIGHQAHIEIVDQSEVPYKGQINIDEIVFTNVPPLEEVAFDSEHRHFGTVALTALEPSSTSIAGGQTLEQLLDHLSRDGCVSGISEAAAPLHEAPLGAVHSRARIEPGETKELVFLVTWYFPNRELDAGGYSKPGDPIGGGKRVGNAYANWFESAEDVAAYVAKNFDRLNDDTFKFRDSYFNSSLPYWLLQRISMTNSVLATETTQWWRNGRFWGWEGVGCCPGTCNHVWNYAQSMGRLFPELERSVREFQDFGETMDPETGKILSRASVPSGLPNQNAMDGQAGTILKAYREHLVSDDGAFLSRNWSNVRRALQWLLLEDVNADGVLEGEQENTYDTSYFGANALVGVLYLSALRAGEEMALVMDEDAYAIKLRRLFEQGSRALVNRLWNGEFFIQDVDVNKHPNQQGLGCLADQLFGQNWAHQVGLGHLLPRKQVLKTLEAIWRYNWAPNVISQNRVHEPARVFARDDESGLINCTWPQSKHLGENAVRYRNEVWTGVEYQVAAHMFYEGMVEKGLAIVRAVDERYEGTHHNPWNEIECGDHYARSMAAWGCLLGLSGFNYDGPRREIGFAPKLKPESFSTFFSAAEGWGNFIQKQEGSVQHARFEIHWGRLKLRTVRLMLLPGQTAVQVSVSSSQGDQAVALSVDERGAVVKFEQEFELAAGQVLDMYLS
ncbi:GH116 family glycosyl hydrolase [Haliea sp.]